MEKGLFQKIAMICRHSMIVLFTVMIIVAEMTVLSCKTTAYAADSPAAAVVRNMGPGWNLGNSLDAMNFGYGYTANTETKWGNPVVTKSLIDGVRAAGFRSIRIPVSWYNHLDANGNIDPAWLQRVGEAVRYALDDGMYVIINVHHDAGNDRNYSWIYSDTDSYEVDRSNLMNLWSQIASYFRDYDDRLLFEPVNEIMNKEHNWNWGTAYADFRVTHDLEQEFINVVRSSGENNATRYLVLPTWGASADSCQIQQLFYKGFTDSASGRLIMSVHNYSTNTAAIDGIVARLASSSATYGIPVVIDESGSGRGTSEDIRVAAAAEWANRAHENGMAYFWWDNGSEYRIINRTTGAVESDSIVAALTSAYGLQ